VPQVEKPESATIARDESAAPAFAERVDRVIAFLRRQWWIILIFLVLSLPFGAFYHFTAPPTYTASATMMIETRKSPIPEMLVDAVPDAGWIESQIGILKSQNVAAYVVKQLRLADDPEFSRSDSILDKMLVRVGLKTAEPRTEAERASMAIGAVMSQVDVRRVGQSYMMRIDVRWHSPDQAARIANAMVDAYTFEQLNAKYQASRRAGDWLQERLQTLREQTAAAERAVIEFRAKNNIVRANGTLMNEKSLGDISNQLGAARASATDLQIRLERIGAVRQSYQEDQPTSSVDETISEAMSNAIIGGLRARYLDLINREADWSTRYGKNHVAVVNLRNQIRDIRKSIRDELGRIEETTRSEYEIAKKRQAELEKALGGLVSQSTETNQAQITLFSLEATAQSYRKIYDSFLQRHTESLQQQSYPISDARTISPAGGASKTGPQGLKIWMITIFSGGMLGFGIAMLREMMDRGFRTREQVRSILEKDCLALVPLLTDQTAPVLSIPASVRMPQFAAGITRRLSSAGHYAAAQILRTVIDAPASAYAEAVRSIKLTVDLNNPEKYTKIIGLTSSLPSEGKSTLAVAMATLIAQSGARVILVDCDVRNPSLSRMLTPDASLGFLDVVAGKTSLADAIWSDATGNMSFLPIVAHSRSANVAEVLASDATKALFGTLQLKYDYVIVDLAPLIATVDVRATSRFIDSYVLVIEWGATKVDAVQYALRNAPDVQANIVGAVLNKVDLASLGRYDSYGANYYYGQSRQAVRTN